MYTQRLQFLFLLAGILFSSNAYAYRGAPDTTPLIFLPFERGETVNCVQGNHGHYSHFGRQEYAYDFDMGDSSNSPSNPIFGVPVYAPFSGRVMEIRDGVQDFTLNSEASSANHYGWGNTIVIRADGEDDHYFRFAHLRYDSIPSDINEGIWIEQGTLIGEVGQTGYSSHPHLHMQMMRTTSGYSEPFDFVEGPVGTDTEVTSQLEQGLYVIENDRRANLGAPIDNPNSWWTGPSRTSLYNSRAGNGSTGDDYRTSTDPDIVFSWGFTILIRGTYDVYASCRGMSNRDPNARYRITRNGLNFSRRVDQRILGRNRYASIGTHTLRAGKRYYVSVERSSGRLCADAIYIRYHGD
jgi:hypothetical protein